MTLRDRAIGNQHGELEKLEVRVEAKSDICPLAWLGNIDGSLDAPSHCPLLENNLPFRMRPDDWAELTKYAQCRGQSQHWGKLRE